MGKTWENRRKHSYCFIHFFSLIHFKAKILTCLSTTWRYTSSSTSTTHLLRYKISKSSFYRRPFDSFDLQFRVSRPFRFRFSLPLSLLTCVGQCTVIPNQTSSPFWVSAFSRVYYPHLFILFYWLDRILSQQIPRTVASLEKKIHRLAEVEDGDIKYQFNKWIVLFAGQHGSQAGEQQVETGEDCYVTSCYFPYFFVECQLWYELVADFFLVLFEQKGT